MSYGDDQLLEYALLSLEQAHGSGMKIDGRPLVEILRDRLSVPSGMTAQEYLLPE